MGLQEYNRKRRFDETPEPEGQLEKRRGNSFVIQKHRASRLHYDLRLEMEGVLRSWAVPKGPSLDPGEKRLAVQTEDHPVDYGSFEGVIPKDNYGAGKVIIWDQGTYEMVDPQTPEAGWKKRKFHFVLHGKKLGGEWVLVQTRRGERQWIFFKVGDDYAAASDVTELRPESVVSGVLVEQVGEQGADARHWHVGLESELESRGMKKGRRTVPPSSVAPMPMRRIVHPDVKSELRFVSRKRCSALSCSADETDSRARRCCATSHHSPMRASVVLLLPPCRGDLDSRTMHGIESRHGPANPVSMQKSVSCAPTLAMSARHGFVPFTSNRRTSVPRHASAPTVRHAARMGVVENRGGRRTYRASTSTTHSATRTTPTARPPWTGRSRASRVWERVRPMNEEPSDIIAPSRSLE